MASILSHAVASAGIKSIFRLSGSSKRLFLLCAICAVIPDADAIGFWLGVPYESTFGHRGFTHSFFFAFIFSLLVVVIFYRQEKVFSKQWFLYLLCFFIAGSSHPMLDAMTTGGLGVAFFSPFSNERYFFPFRPIKVSPIGISAFFSSWGLAVLKSEFIFVWLPSFAVMAATNYFYKKKS